MGGFSKNFKFEAGRGNQISFWHDLWSGNMALMVTFPSLFRNVLDKGASVADCMDNTTGFFQWLV